MQLRRVPPSTCRALGQPWTTGNVATQLGDRQMLRVCCGKSMRAMCQNQVDIARVYANRIIRLMIRMASGRACAAA